MENRSASDAHEGERAPEPAPIYLDHHATTPCDPRVVEAMLPYFSEDFGNPASRTHAFGWSAERALEEARERVAALIGATPREIVFTSGATEANNLALLGTAAAMEPRRGATPHVVTCQTEHRAVLDPCRALAKRGLRVTEVGVRGDGTLDLDALVAALEPDTRLISLMHANNEIGVVHDLAAVAERARARGILLHTDAAQSAGRIPVDVGELGVDLLSLSGHKLHGPKGIGALYVRRRRPALPIRPLLYGGGQERGLRSGTVPVPLCVGLGRACEIARSELSDEAARLRSLRDRLWSRLQEAGDVWLNGHPEQRLPGNLHVSFGGIEAEALLLGLPELALSTGSACTSAQLEPSHVLRAIGLSRARALGSVRIGLGRGTRAGEIERAADLILAQVARLRALAPRARVRSA